MADITPRVNSGMQTLAMELAGMKMGALKKRAREAGVTQEQLDDADDDDDPRGAVVELIASAPSAEAAAGAPAPPRALCI